MQTARTGGSFRRIAKTVLLRRRIGRGRMGEAVGYQREEIKVCTDQGCPLCGRQTLVAWILAVVELSPILGTDTKAKARMSISGHRVSDSKADWAVCNSLLYKH